MFKKENIVFENDILMGGSMVSKEEIVDAVYDASLELISEMNITSLVGIVIKPLVLFESTLGTARSNGEKSIVELAYITAVNIREDPERNVIEKHKEAKATIYHEFCHIRDYELVWKRLSPNAKGDSIIKLGYDVWTEFYATYASFSKYEDVRLYDSFKNSFEKRDEKRDYYTSRLIGYYLNEGHNPCCERLINLYLNKDVVDNLIKRLKKMLIVYENITEDDLCECGKLIKKTRERTVVYEKLTPINSYNLFIKKLK